MALISLEVFPVDRLIWLLEVLQVPPDSRLHGEVVGIRRGRGGVEDANHQNFETMCLVDMHDMHW